MKIFPLEVSIGTSAGTVTNTEDNTSAALQSILVLQEGRLIKIGDENVENEYIDIEHDADVNSATDIIALFLFLLIRISAVTRDSATSSGSRSSCRTWCRIWRRRRGSSPSPLSSIRCCLNLSFFKTHPIMIQTQ